MLDDTLPPGAYETNRKVRPDSDDTVEFVVIMPCAAKTRHCCRSMPSSRRRTTKGCWRRRKPGMPRASGPLPAGWSVRFASRNDTRRRDSRCTDSRCYATATGVAGTLRTRSANCQAFIGRPAWSRPTACDRCQGGRRAGVGRQERCPSCGGKHAAVDQHRLVAVAEFPPEPAVPSQHIREMHLDRLESGDAAIDQFRLAAAALLTPQRAVARQHIRRVAIRHILKGRYGAGDLGAVPGITVFAPQLAVIALDKRPG